MAGNRDSRCYSTMSFNKNIVVVEPSYQMLYRDFIILFLGEGLTFFNKDNSANFPDEKKKEKKKKKKNCEVLEKTVRYQIKG